MRCAYHLIELFATSLLLALTASCRHSSQEEATAVNDSSTLEEPIITPINDISIKGEWKSKDNPLYPIIQFKGKSTVVVNTVMGSFASSYERDEEFIRVRTDKSDLLFEIVGDDSIIGTGFAKGIWIRQK